MTSLLDRLGCRDTDGDGCPDLTESWPAHPFGLADAFPTEALQWMDSIGRLGTCWARSATIAPTSFPNGTFRMSPERGRMVGRIR